jgi:hypothetical protein
MASSSADIKAAAVYVPVAIVTYVVVLAVTIVIHEFVHSTWAWALGYMPRPFSIEWGNPVTMKGWDEGVPYTQLFPLPGNSSESVIGGSPLVFHTIVVIAGLFLLQRQWMMTKKWLFHIVYWFVVVALMELIAYIWMRPFAPGGDTGHFNHGLDVSPWFLFVVGGLLLLAAVYVFFQNVMPTMANVIAPGNQLTPWAILVITSFVMFLWGSGIRMLSQYPNPEWRFGLIGVVAFVVALVIYRPKVSRSTTVTGQPAPSV